MAASPPAALVASELLPVAAQERVLLFDVLRGSCLFGVLWSNLNDWFTVLEPVTPLDHALAWIQDWLIEERFYSMLGFLFGIGFAIQLTRTAQRGQDVRRLFVRRMVVLLGIGLVHATLIWQGDILTQYALAGLALVLFRNWSPRKLLLAAVALSLLYPYLVLHLTAVLNIPLPNYDAGWRQLGDQALQAYAHGTWIQAVSHGTEQFRGWLYRALARGGTAGFLALFLLGLWAVRVNLSRRLTRRRSVMLWALVCAAACWAGSQYAWISMSVWWPPLRSAADWRDPLFWSPRGVVSSFFNHVATWANAAVYALAIALAMSFPMAARRLQPLAALGRMALTTYLTQSLVSTLVFYNWGFGLMNTVNRTGILIFTIVLVSSQIAFSVWWLRRYQFGPAEWLWRSLAYGRRLPFRTASAPPAVAITVN